jgi:hypothetical protein
MILKKTNKVDPFNNYIILADSYARTNVNLQHTRSVFQMNSFLSLLKYPPYFNLLDIFFYKDGIFLFAYELTFYICIGFWIIYVIQIDNIDFIMRF